MSDSEKKVYLKARVVQSIHSDFKKAAIDEQKSMEELLSEIVENWLESRKKKK